MAYNHLKLPDFKVYLPSFAGRKTVKMSFKRLHWFGVLIFTLLATQHKAQSAMNFVRFDSIPVSDGVQALSMAWGGGMDMLQYSEIDLDLDGTKDLFVFDRSGHKITTYINLGTPNTVSYVLAPQYVYDFPVLHDWALLRDYNCDGKEDIFTCSVAGFSIYKNISSQATGVQFQLVETLVYTNRSPNSTNFMGNLYVSTIDLPAIRDLDGDGDLDILTFSNGGAQVEYHRNISMETYGVCDSIAYEVSSNCWGKFSENATSAAINLNSGCPPVPLPGPSGNDNQRVMHSGSCLECFNFDGDTVLDVLIGDVGSPNMVYVHNSTTPDSAIIDTYEALYPAANVSVNINLFPCPAHLDVNNDGIRDLLISPAASTFSENKFSSLYYMNAGTNDAVVSTFVQNDFLQENMIDVGDGCYPVLYDYDSDGDKDLLIGNHGYYSSSGPYQSKIALYQNNGTPLVPSFIFVTDDFANIYSGGSGISNLAPTFGDLDGDGDKDMLIGDFAGQLHLFTKGTGPSNFVLTASNYQGIDVGEFATPQLIDVNRDGKTDLLVGDKTGRIHYYENTGTAAAPVFTLTTATFGGVNVCAPGWYTGYSTPLMFEDNGTYSMVVGSQRGWIYRYDNIEGNLAGTFTLTDSMYVSWREGGSVSPAIADLDGDGWYDMIIGNYAGGISCFRGDDGLSTQDALTDDENTLHIFPVPANDEITVQIGFNPGSNSTYSISDISGKIVDAGKINHQQTRIDVSRLGNGIYTLSILCPDGMINRKLIITRE